MLHSLTVSNIVLIEQLTLQFPPGLTVLTGETGAGKSILLDALGLALGSRADFGLIRQGHEQAHVSASFALPATHPAWQLVEDAGIMPEDEMILRRRLKNDGKSTASINDIAVSIGLLRQVGDLLVEIQGQFEGRGLLDVSTHMALLDRAAAHRQLLAQTKQGWQQWHAASQALDEARAALDQAKAEEDWLRDAVDALDRLAPETGEEDALTNKRTLLANVTKIGESLALAEEAVFGDDGAQASLGQALAALEKAAPLAGGQLDQALDALIRADAELGEASSAIHSAANTLEADPNELHQLDDRLHELRQQARKHGCSTDELPLIHQTLADRLAAIEDSSGALGSLGEIAQKWQDYYIDMAGQLETSRKQAATKLDKAVRAELPPLKLEGAQFTTVVSPLAKAQWGPRGTTVVRFEASTNQGMKAGPIDQIASGGELARFLLALKVCLEESSHPRSLIFDEVDSGVGGAVAAAVGQRLCRLGATTQTLVITHSPQVAARASQHLRIAKTTTNSGVVSVTVALSDAERTEEIARMLAGETVTDEARAAAAALIGG
ncbi:MAG: DNA repair protein RecN [Candidatus Puniceispirillum sp.]|nr:DNA repair protein RecN [Candidatus Puniceispirillum sp.]MBL6774243.1 DNA repair protein RecN [Candidatus Puniceispirillum sp.]